MKNKRNIWIGAGVLFLCAIVSGFMLMQPSAKDILIATLDNAETVTSGHAIVEFEVNTLEDSMSGTVEIWGRRDGEANTGAFRLQVLDASEAKAIGTTIVTDGETLWAFNPTENVALVTTAEEVVAMLEEMEANGEFEELKQQMPEHNEGDMPEHPETSEEAVAKLLEYVTASIEGREALAAGPAWLVKLAPIAEQMPEEYLALGGFVNLWIDSSRNVPLAAELTGTTFGDARATAIEIDINPALSDSIFTFIVPAGVEVLTLEDVAAMAEEYEAQSLTEEEVASLDYLSPADLPAGAALVEVFAVRDVFVQQYTLPKGGFTVAQGAVAAPEPEGEAGETVDVRGTTGTLFSDEDGGRVLLVWSEGKTHFAVAGDLSAEQALTLAKSLE